ncbi:MAG: heparinase II/III family protein [Phycisphaeraceae bacterium]|nr:heparinase II/III family protein [Phycisphaeraceae bacterium]
MFTRISRIVLVLILSACSSGHTSAEAQQAKTGGEASKPVFPAPPRTATSTAEWEATKKSDNFAARRAAAIAAAQPLVDKPVPLPDGYGEWIFYYANMETGTPLVYVSPTEHKDPVTGKIFSDERTIAAYRCKLHYDSERAALALGWAYQYTGDDQYVAGVKRILLKYADDYHTYPGRLDRWGHKGILAPLGGRRYVQSLDEAVGAISLAQAYDLTRNSPAWNVAEKQHVEEDFFRATADSLLRFNQGINNHQTWYNAGLIAIASVLQDADLVERVLTMNGGVYFQLEKSIGNDGMWYEGSMAYHNYALQPMVQIADMTRRLGLDIYRNPKLKSMILGPLHATYPDGTFPVINDSDPNNIAMLDWAFEWGWHTYHEMEFAQAWARGDNAKLKKLVGADVQAVWPPHYGSEALADAGLAMLRQGEGKDASCVVMDYGPHGGGHEGGHGHYDKLSITLFTNGREWLLDPGRLDYSHPEYKTWVKKTAAHNTVTLGGVSQEATTGKLLWLKNGEGWTACAAQSDEAYPGSMLRRYLMLTPEFFVDVFEVEADRQTQIDLFAHATADDLVPSQSPAKAEPATLGTDDGYQHLKETQRITRAENDNPWRFVRGKDSLPFYFVSLPGEQVFTTRGIGYYVHQKTPTLVRRVNGKSARFVTVYALRGTESIESITPVIGDKGETRVTVIERVNDQRRTWQIDLGPTKVEVTQPK